MNLLDLAYAPTLGAHFLWHLLVTRRYGPRAMEKIGELPDRFRSSETAALGSASAFREPPCLWLHAVSVGEAVAAAELGRMFLADHPLWEIRVSVTTATGRSVAEKHFGAANVIYFPLDFSGMVARAFDRIRPSLVTLMELEIWPNFLAEAARRAVPVAVANARITERSARRLSLAPWLARRMALTVDAWYVQTEEYAARLRRLGVPEGRMEILGSMKYDSTPDEVDPGAGRVYRRLFGCGDRFQREGGRPLAVAGSTHPGEERVFLEALRDAAPAGRDRPLAALAPRHPERLDEVERLASTFGRVARRSRLPDFPLPGDPGPGADIILVDGVGELARIYAAADMVFVGGSLTRRGGQNFLEACGLGKPTVVGPHLWNFREPAELLGGLGLLRRVEDREGLRLVFAEWLANPTAAADLGGRARVELRRRRGATRKTADRLGELVKNRIVRPTAD